MDIIRQTMIKYRERAGLNQEQMGAMLGLSQQVYGNIETGKKKSLDVDFVNKYKAVTGIDLASLKQNVVEENVLNDPSTNDYQKKRFNNKLSAVPQFMVPLVPVKAQAGYITSHQFFDFIESLEKYPIAPGINPRGYEWRWFEISGDSMEPHFQEGDFVLCSMVPEDDWQNIKPGLVYIVVTSDDVVIKRILPKNKKQWVMASDNKEYKQYLVEIDDVKEVWKFRRNLNARVPPAERIQIEV